MTGARVLVIEDDANNLDVAERIIRAAGHEPIAATDGAAGLAAARTHHPDAILVDLLLPQVDGWTIARTLRQEEWAREVPIIAVSALARSQEREAALRAGCDAYLSKPFTPDELTRIIAGTLVRERVAAS